MTASLKTLVIATYVFATSVAIPRPGPAGLITDHELIALAVAQAATGEFAVAFREAWVLGPFHRTAYSRWRDEHRYGYCPSKSVFVWGVRLVLFGDIKGTPVGYTSLAPRPARNANRRGSWHARNATACCSPTAASGAPNSNAT